ncbi:MAG: hypothetical protein IMY72_12960 [Bacteroidetes bacterium]|nr:hypothetical protein [Bacteroidota bacterium]
MRKFIFIFLFFTIHIVNAQDSLNFIISNRVIFKEDTVKREVFELYKNYFYSHPDSIYDNPYWNRNEKDRYYRFDLSISSIYNGVDFETLKKYFNFYVLSIEKYDINKYTLRVLIQVKGGLSNGSSVWCIHKVSAIKENANWVLQNNIVKETSKWESYKIGVINYHYSPYYNFNEALANEANSFIDTIATNLNISKNINVDYYLAEDVDELGMLIGFDYFFTGITSGLACLKDDYIMSTNGEFHAYETVHIMLKSKYSRNFMIEEGLAEFLGTKKQFPKKYRISLSKLTNDVLHSDGYTIENLLAQKAPYKGYNYKYPFGAILCELVYEEKGFDGIKELAFSDTKTESDLIKVLSNIIEVKQEKLQEIILNYIELF